MSQDGGDDRFMKLIAAMAAMGQAASGGGESQIHTQEQITVTTRFKLQLFHMCGVFLAFVGFILGLFLFTLGLDWLFAFGWEPRFYLLAWALATMAVLAVAWLVERLLDRLGAEVVTVVQAFIMLALLLLFGLAAFALMLTTRERFGWQLLAMVGGAGLMLACPALGYNQLMDLLNPYWRRSPYEQAITSQLLPPLAEFLAGMGDSVPSGDVREEDPRWQQRASSQYGVVARPIGVQKPEADDWNQFEDEEAELVTIDPEAGNLIWFVRYAAQMPSLSIKDLSIEGTDPLLPFPEGGKQRRLRRDMIRRLLARGSTGGKVVVDGHTEHGMGEGGFWHLQGQGATPTWAMDKLEARLRALEMWRSVYGDELPVPDYHNVKETRQGPSTGLDEFDADVDDLVNKNAA